jgi:hypothetical protein
MLALTDPGTTVSEGYACASINAMNREPFFKYVSAHPGPRIRMRHSTVALPAPAANAVVNEASSHVIWTPFAAGEGSGLRLMQMASRNHRLRSMEGLMPLRCPASGWAAISVDPVDSIRTLIDYQIEAKPQLTRILLGLIAEMLVGTYFESQQRRAYSVRELINFGSEKH